MPFSENVPIPRQRLVRRLTVPVAALLLALAASASAADGGGALGALVSPLHRAAPATVPGGVFRETAVRRVSARVARRARRAKAREMNPLGQLPLYVEPGGPARAQANAWRASRPAHADLIAGIADQPQSLWLGDWRYDVRAVASRRVAAGRAEGTVPVFVAYNVPDRDCGQHSSGGAADAAAYGRWIDDLATGIGASPAIVVLEPDALAGMDCLSAAQRDERVSLMAAAVDRLSHLAATAVYIDAGNPGWISVAAMARRLRAAGVGGARGFAVNVSGFQTTARATAYGTAISRRTGGAHFIVDTSRNGVGPLAPGEWCNPPGRALGPRPTTDTGDPLVDAYLWIKRPGESDGTCNGGPPAGSWWGEYALGLAQRAATS